MRRKILTVLILILAWGVFAFSSEIPLKSRDGFAMNTLIKISAYSKDEKVIDDAYELLGDLDQKLSMYDSSSVISKINSSSGINKVYVSSDVIEVIKDSLRVYEITGGVFNPLIGPVTNLWRINKADNKIPSQESLDKAVKLSEISNLELDENSVYLKSEGCMIDLSGITKGFAGRKISDMFESKGIESALIDLGGNVQVLGTKPDGKKWNIGVRDPSDSRGSPALVLSVSDTAVVTSGGYERYKTVNGKKYSHFFDSKTGNSITNELLSATVVTPDGSMADGLATAFMVSGLNKSLKIAENLPDSIGIILIFQNENDKIEILISKNIKDLISRSRYEIKIF